MNEELLIRMTISMKSGLHCNDRLRLEEHVREYVQTSADEKLHQAASALQILEGMRARIIHLYDGDYPPLLRELYDPPYLLAVIGELPPPDEPSVAVLGPERPSTGACISAWSFGLEAGYARTPVVSCCTGAWAAALQEGVRTAGGCLFQAVTGIPEDLPRWKCTEHADKTAESGGGLVMEITSDDVSHEARRNRLVCGLSRSVLLLEAAAGASILDAADEALDQGRDVTVHRRGISSPWGRGTKNLYESGAPAVSWLGDIHRLWGYDTDSTPRVRYHRTGDQAPPNRACRIRIGGMDGWFERIR